MELSMTQPCAQFGEFSGGPKITILFIPVYGRIDLLDATLQSLSTDAKQLGKHKSKIVILNAAPGNLQMKEKLGESLSKFSALPVETIDNPSIQSSTEAEKFALSFAADARQDLIFIQSGSKFAEGSLLELARVAKSDEKIAFVNPVSNIGLRPGFFKNEVSEKQFRRTWERISHRLPPHFFISISCRDVFYCKWQIASEFLQLLEIDGEDIKSPGLAISKIVNQFGYRVARANQAFTWVDESNQMVENSLVKYSENDFNRFKTETLLGSDLNENNFSIGFDLVHFTNSHNGTFEATLKLLSAVCSLKSKDLQLYVIVSEKGWEFHNLDKIGDLKRINPEDINVQLDAILRVGFPYAAKDIKRIALHAPINVYYCLDTIALDCEAISATWNKEIWDWICIHADLILTNSNFTQKQLLNRFTISPHTKIQTLYHSLNLADYGYKSKIEKTGEPSSILIVGNSFSHKYVNQTTDMVAKANPETKIAALGYTGELEHENLISLKSGELTSEELDTLWKDAQVIVYPSHYEGFGFPILHALAMKKPIYVRASELQAELSNILSGAENIHTFETTADLVSMLGESQTKFAWKEPKAKLESFDWKDAAQELLQGIRRERQSVEFDRLYERVASINALGGNRPGNPNSFTPAARAGKWLEDVIEALSSNRVAGSTLRALYRSSAKTLTSTKRLLGK
jgi:hypothetical protein